MTGKRNFLIIALTVFLMGVGLPAVSMAVDVFAECAYTDADVVCEIYATSTTELRSGAAALSYNTGELSNPIAEKNEAEWYFGDAASPIPYPNGVITNTTTGEVVFTVGKFDTAALGAGVSGSRKLIGTVQFTRATSTVPVADTATLFAIDLNLRPAPFVNFVDMAGLPLDGEVVLSNTVAERGDADGSGIIDTIDFQIAYQIFLGNLPTNVFADCFVDGVIDTLDFQCSYQKFLRPPL